MEIISYPFRSESSVERSNEVTEKDKQIQRLKHSLSYALLLDLVMIDAMLSNKSAKQKRRVAHEAKSVWTNYSARIAGVRMVGSRFSLFTSRPSLFTQ